MNKITQPKDICCFCNKFFTFQIYLDSCDHTLCQECFEIIQMIDSQKYTRINKPLNNLKQSNPLAQNKVLCPKCKKFSSCTSSKSTKNMLIDSNIIREKMRLQSKNKLIQKSFYFFLNPKEKIRNEVSPYKCLINRSQKIPKDSNMFNSSLSKKTYNETPNQESDIKTPEKGNFFGKRSFSESLKTEKVKIFNENLDDLVKINNDSSFESSGALSFKCKIHNDEMSLFCINDKLILCPSCVYLASENHKNHSIIPLKSAYQIIKKDNEKFRLIAKEKLQKIDDSIKVSMKNISIIDNNLTNLNYEIENEFNNLKKILEKKEKELKESINQICLTKIQTYENKIKDLTFLRDCLNDYKFYDPNIQWDHSTFIYVYNVNSLLKKTLCNIDLNFRILHLHEIEKIDYSNKKKVIKEIELFAQLFTKYDSPPTTNKSLNKTMNSNSTRTELNVSNYDQKQDEYVNNSINLLEKEGEQKSTNGNGKLTFHKRSKTKF